VRISELSAEAGLPVATVKFYLREGLLHPGRAVTGRLSEYDETHVRRLRLVRTLREVGDLPVERIRVLLEATDTPGATVHDVFGIAADALAPSPGPAAADRADLRRVSDRVVHDAGWTHVRPESVDRDNLAAVLEVIGRYGTHPGDRLLLEPYVALADGLARTEIAHLDDSLDRQALLEEMVVGSVVFGRLLAVLRRLAEEHHSFDRFGSDRRS
jgi:DNA-binding transcriptional MerR regulator